MCVGEYEDDGVESTREVGFRPPTARWGREGEQREE